MGCYTQLGQDGAMLFQRLYVVVKVQQCVRVTLCVCVCVGAKSNPRYHRFIQLIIFQYMEVSCSKKKSSLCYANFLTDGS